jgi:regulatory protein
VRITAIEPQKRHPERVNLHVDGAFRLALAAEIVMGEGLRRGDELTEERLAALEARDQGWKARESAMTLLAFRPRSVAELLRRLREKGYADEVAQATVTRLQELGMVNDASFAESFVRDRVRLKPHGARRLQQELRRRGVDPALAGDAIGGVLEREDTSEVELARRAAAKWKPRAGEDPQAAKRRLYGFLARRGFTGDALREVIAERLGSEP